jgi:hypothetical protein
MSSLPEGVNGPRQRAEALDVELEAYRCNLLVLCRRALYGPFLEDEMESLAG